MLRKILCCCGHGLGSSSLIEMVVQEALGELNATEIEVGHVALADLSFETCDLIICAKDLEDECRQYFPTLALVNLMDTAEIKNHLRPLVS